jgi:hypothetical protein
MSYQFYENSMFAFFVASLMALFPGDGRTDDIVRGTS